MTMHGADNSNLQPIRDAQAGADMRSRVCRADAVVDYGTMGPDRAGGRAVKKRFSVEQITAALQHAARRLSAFCKAVS
jgi:hypothetical protein